ncbi:hypothetical protein [Marinobacter daepoensis]|nr:hypothetical protein [Marinobacter daepoensis]
MAEVVLMKVMSFREVNMWLYEKWLARANTGVVISLFGLMLTVLMAYPLATRFPMAIQILAHIGTLLFAVGVKIAYVARLAFLSKLGRPVN